MENLKIFFPEIFFHSEKWKILDIGNSITRAYVHQKMWNQAHVIACNGPYIWCIEGRVRLLLRKRRKKLNKENRQVAKMVYDVIGWRNPPGNFSYGVRIQTSGRMPRQLLHFSQRRASSREIGMEICHEVDARKGTA